MGTKLKLDKPKHQMIIGIDSTHESDPQLEMRVKENYQELCTHYSNSINDVIKNKFVKNSNKFKKNDKYTY